MKTWLTLRRHQTRGRLISAPQPIDELNTTGNESEASITEDGRSIFFARGSSSDRDVLRATRDDAGLSWSAPLPIDEIDTAEAEADPSISPDGRILVFTRVSSGANRFYQASR